MVFLSCDLSWFARSDSISGSQFTRNLISNQENLRSNPLNSISFHSIHRTDGGDTPDHTLMIENRRGDTASVEIPFPHPTRVTSAFLFL
jgi:hypothetical protein